MRPVALLLLCCVPDVVRIADGGAPAHALLPETTAAAASAARAVWEESTDARAPDEVNAVGEAYALSGPPVHTVSLLQRSMTKPASPMLLGSWPAPAPPAVSALAPQPVVAPRIPADSAQPEAVREEEVRVAVRPPVAEDNHRPVAQALAPAPSPRPPAELPGMQPAQMRSQPVQASRADLAASAAGGMSSAELDDAGLSRVCVPPADLEASLRESVKAVLAGLPPWPHKVAGPKTVEHPVVAYLTQVSFAEQLPLVARVFTRIYTPQDIFVYLVDAKLLDADLVRAVLPEPLPANVQVRRARHAGYYYWPRVQVLLDGLAKLLEQRWDFVVHLSESDYPVHSAHWLRRTLGRQRQKNFMTIMPRCTAESPHFSGADGDWYWWERQGAVASCESSFEPTEVPSTRYPLEELESAGFRFASGPEWMVLTRELVEYATMPGLAQYRRLIGMHAAADEIFWTTLVLNIPGFKQSVSRQSWYIHWKPGGWTHSPETVTADHLPLILGKRELFLFVRKVDEVSSRDVLEELDKLIRLPEDDAPEGPDPEPDWDKTTVACVPGPSLDTVVGTFPSPAPPAEPADAMEMLDIDCERPYCP